MKKYKLYLSINLLLIVSMFGCKKLVEVDSPKTELVTETVYKSNETANSAVLTIYGFMFSSFTASPYHIPLYTGIYGDELTNYNNSLSTLYINDIDPTGNNTTNSFWNESYKFIYLANSAYEGCIKSDLLDPDVKKQLMGEALFIRAYWYFYLVNLYGNVPLVLSTNYEWNATLPRSSIQKIYEQAINDLLSARNNLNDNYVGANGLATSTEKIRPNKSAATALLARIYLYAGDYLEAEKQATQLINNTSYVLEPMERVFLKNNKEAIWQIMATNNPSYNTQEGFGFIPTGVPPAQGKATISSQLLGAFEVGDLRRSKWIGKYTDVSKTPNMDYYYPFKYKVQTGPTLSEYTMPLRLAEQYLIRAEARNEQNNSDGAISDLNNLRSRARDVSGSSINPLPALENTLSKDQVKSAILHERQVELFAEYGHRWLDLKRTKNIDAIMGIVTPTKGGGIWGTNKQLWPIPQTEVLNNPNMKQNPGYN